MLLLAVARCNLKAERRIAQSEFARVSTLSIMHCARHVVMQNLSFVRAPARICRWGVGSWRECARGEGPKIQQPLGMHFCFGMTDTRKKKARRSNCRSLIFHVFYTSPPERTARSWDGARFKAHARICVYVCVCVCLGFSVAHVNASISACAGK